MNHSEKETLNRGVTTESHLADDVTIVIRASGERTELLCENMILDQGVSPENVFTIHEVPFSASMRKAFKTGLDRGRKWTFCVDADVLLRPGAISGIVEFANSCNKNVCEVQGYVMDKFFGGPRQAGNHLYRTSLLQEVIDRIPEEGVDIRPERFTLGEMAKDGYPWMHAPLIVGLHDSDQYFFDIYRKAFVHAVKHLERSELFISLWRERSKTDPDFNVAMRGFADSLLTDEQLFIDKSQSLYSDLFEKTGIVEKKAIEKNAYTLEMVEQIINEWETPPVYYSYFPSRDGLDTAMAAQSGRIKRSLKERGVVKTGKLILSSLFIQIGKRLRDS